MSAPAPQQSTDIHAKALTINLEASFYGTFAEIGAGQVARCVCSHAYTALILAQTSARVGPAADHVNHLGLGRSQDWELMKFILEREYTFVTNNRSDFLALYRRTALHASHVYRSNVRPFLHRELFQAALRCIGEWSILVSW